MDVVINNRQITLTEIESDSLTLTNGTRIYCAREHKEEGYKPVSAYEITIDSPELSAESSAILLGYCGATGVSRDSIAFTDNMCFVAIGDSLLALSMPSLELKWSEKVDFATCIGVYYLDDEECLITWGELDVCRFTTEGFKEWCFSGADILTEGFELQEKHIKVKDFNYHTYNILIKTGLEILE